MPSLGSLNLGKAGQGPFPPRSRQRHREVPRSRSAYRRAAVGPRAWRQKAGRCGRLFLRRTWSYFLVVSAGAGAGAGAGAVDFMAESFAASTEDLAESIAA